MNLHACWAIEIIQESLGHRDILHHIQEWPAGLSVPRAVQSSQLRAFLITCKFSLTLDWGASPVWDSGILRCPRAIACHRKHYIWSGFDLIYQSNNSDSFLFLWQRTVLGPQPLKLGFCDRCLALNLSGLGSSLVLSLALLETGVLPQTWAHWISSLLIATRQEVPGCLMLCPIYLPDESVASFFRIFLMLTFLPQPAVPFF